MSQELSDEMIEALIPSAYKDGVYLGYGKSDLKDFARAVIAADRAKRVTMTESECFDAFSMAEQCELVKLDRTSFAEGIRAAEAFHGIGSKT